MFNQDMIQEIEILPVPFVFNAPDEDVWYDYMTERTEEEYFEDADWETLHVGETIYSEKPYPYKDDDSADRFCANSFDRYAYEQWRNEEEE